MFKFGLPVFLIVFLSLLFPSPISAQPDIKTAKQVISTYKSENFEKLFPLTPSDCNLREKGDANCDGKVDLADLSLWEIEFKSQKSTKWSDFNGDGKVSLIDFKTWKESQNRSRRPISLIQKEQGSFLQAIMHGIKKLFGATVFAQSQNPDTSTGIVSTSYPITYPDGSSIVVNGVEGGQQYIDLDPNGNPLGSRHVSADGTTLSRSLILDSGEEISLTTQNGVNIQTVKKSQGPLIQFFGDENTPFVVKSWPTAESAERGDPPIAVSIPVNNQGELSMVVNPNGTTVISHTDQTGDTLSETQIRADGTHLSRNYRHQTVVESNEKLGASFARVPNRLGGFTSYYFYQSALYTIVQTDKDGNYHIAKPLDDSGTNWSQSSTVNGQNSEKTVTDPIADLNSGVPSPLQLIDKVNNYKSASSTINVINFSDAFGSTGVVPQDQITAANRILNIQSIRPQVLGAKSGEQKTAFNLIKEVSADSEEDENYDEMEVDVVSQVAATGSVDKTKVSDQDKDSKVVVKGNTQTAQVVNRTTNTSVVSQTNSLDNNGGWTSNGAQTNSAHSQVQTQSKPYQYYYTATSKGTPSGPAYENTYKSDSSCFLAGTLISTPNGKVAIEKLTPHDLVVSFNEKTGLQEVASFRKLDINFVDEYLIVNNKIKTTTYHPFYVFDRDMTGHHLVKAGNLRQGDLVVDEFGKLVSVNTIEKVFAKSTVYNLLAVTPNNNFYAEGVLVHNYNNNDNYTNSHSAQSDNSNNNDQSSMNSVSSDPL